ncbi:hypothetical protein M5689_012622 [Euphorbia peplus]|nr:hypothetical protein M5689_012622 [Euphorbia peplus]
MEKSWMKESRSSKPYIDGVSNFIKFALEKTSIDGAIYCPCRKCFNRYSFSSETVHEHLLWNGILEGYDRWVLHGESILFPSNNQPNSSISTSTGISQSSADGSYDIQGLLGEAFALAAQNQNNDNSNLMNDHSALGSPEEIPYSPNYVEEHPENESSSTINATTRLQQLMEDHDKELYPGCSKFSKLSFILRLYHLKCLHGWSGKSFSMLLELLKDAFPCDNTVPSSYYESKKIIKDLGLGYEKIDACPNDCILYWGDKKNLEQCSICATSRWETNKDDNSQPQDDESEQPRKKKPAKVLRYFPLIPRLKRLYMSSKTAFSMTWHANGRNKDGKIRHPADALAWKYFNELYPEFAADPRNVRLGLASDGFNPFGTMSTTYSTWPVVLIPYNLEPWVCMKQSSLILSMVIPGEKGPGNDIDVFLQPLIAELLQLWDGVDAYDAYTRQNFKLRAALIWTINDFPAYANLSGWSTKGRVACPCCVNSTHSQWLKHGGKFSYMGHRMWLDPVGRLLDFTSKYTRSDSRSVSIQVSIPQGVS